MGLFAKFVKAMPETVANRYFGGVFYGTGEQKMDLACSLLLTFKLAHNEQLPNSMDELGRWVDTEFGHHVGHVYIKNWPEFMDTVAARHGTTLNLYANKYAEEIGMMHHSATTDQSSGGGSIQSSVAVGSNGDIAT